MGYTINVKLDLAGFKDRFNRLRRALSGEGFRALLHGIASRLELASRQAFERQSSPSGTPWRPLALRTAAAKTEQGFSQQSILSRTGRLRESTIGGVDGNIAFVGSRLPYAAAHQFGATIQIPEIRPRRARALRFLGSNLEVVFARHARAHRVTIPARPFLPSAQQAEEIGRDEVEGALEILG